MPQCGLVDPDKWPNSANLNYYVEKKDGVGTHADDEPLFNGMYEPITIISLSLGGARDFELCGKRQGSKALWRHPLGDGDLLAMEQWTQLHMRHSILKLPDDSAECPQRVNITRRWLVNHRKGCPLAECTTSPSPSALPLEDPCESTVASSDAAWLDIRPPTFMESTLPAPRR